jgi:hypothetical protein
MAMISGAHVVIYSTDPEADRAFFRDVLHYPYADAGHGWLIFALPPAEVAVHPAAENGRHELYLMCDDIEALIIEMRARSLKCGPVEEQPWGSLTHLTLPGGGALGIYQPKHASPLDLQSVPVT